MIWYIFAFLFFILVDVFIFTQKWTLLVISLIAGGVFLLIALILRGLFPDRKAAAPQPNEQYVQPPQQGPAYPQAVQPQGAAVIDRDTRFSQPPEKDSILPAVFFYIEFIIVLGLLVWICMK